MEKEIFYFYENLIMYIPTFEDFRNSFRSLNSAVYLSFFREYFYKKLYFSENPPRQGRREEFFKDIKRYLEEKIKTGTFLSFVNSEVYMPSRESRIISDSLRYKNL